MQEGTSRTNLMLGGILAFEGTTKIVLLAEKGEPGVKPIQFEFAGAHGVN